MAFCRRNGNKLEVFQNKIKGCEKQNPVQPTKYTSLHNDVDTVTDPQDYVAHIPTNMIMQIAGANCCVAKYASLT